MGMSYVGLIEDGHSYYGMLIGRQVELVQHVFLA